MSLVGHDQLISYRDNLALNRLYPSIKSACLHRTGPDSSVDRVYAPLMGGLGYDPGPRHT